MVQTRQLSPYGTKAIGAASGLRNPKEPFCGSREKNCVLPSVIKIAKTELITNELVLEKKMS